MTLRFESCERGLSSSLSPQRQRWLRRWFSLGAAAGLLAGGSSVAFLLSELWTLAKPSWTTVEGAEAASTSQEAPRLQLALPGVTLPATHALPLWLGLAGSLLIHEAGHALAAAAEGVAVTGAGVTLLLLVPAAFVELDSADLAALGKASMLRIATAGVWHNVVVTGACWLVMPSLAAAVAGGGAAAWAAGPLRLLLGYAASLSAALALLNMAPVHYLDGQQALEALALRPARPVKPLPEQAKPGGGDWGDVRGGGTGSSSSGRRTAAVRWALHAGTALYAAVVLLHVARVR